MAAVGVKPVILAIVVQALWNLAPAAARTWPLRIGGTAAIAAALLGVNELVDAVRRRMLVAAVRRARVAGGSPVRVADDAPTLPLAARACPALRRRGGRRAVSLPGLFWVFLKIGSVLFGSGYVLLAFLRADLVARLHWLTEGQLIDAVAAGRSRRARCSRRRPSSATCWRARPERWSPRPGSSSPRSSSSRSAGRWCRGCGRRRIAGAFLDGVNVASLALMAAVTAQLGRAALVDLTTVVIGLVAATLLLRFKLNSSWLVLGGAAAGLGAHALGIAR